LQPIDSLVEGNASSLYECWSMDFVADQLYNESRFRALTVVDNYSCRCLAIYGGKSLKWSDVVGVIKTLNWLRESLPGV